MSYDLLLIGEVDRARLAGALAELASVPADLVDIADADDPADRNWDAAVLCTCERAGGDISWSLDIYLSDIVTPQPTVSRAAAVLARRFQMPVLYPAAEPLPGAYWLTTPDAPPTRARLVIADLPGVGTLDDSAPDMRIAAVEHPVPALPSLPVMAQPEVIREHRMPTPVTGEFTAWQAGQEDAGGADDLLWLVRARLGLWESLTERMAAGWPPDGWYPAGYYREDLEARDFLSTAGYLMPGTSAARLEISLSQVDERFRDLTTEASDASLAEWPGLSDSELSAPRGWWWRRIPDPLPWFQP